MISWISFPSKYEIAGRDPKTNAETQVRVVSHEDQHEAKTDPELYEVSQCLSQMMFINDNLPAK